MKDPKARRRRAVLLCVGLVLSVLAWCTAFSGTASADEGNFQRASVIADDNAMEAAATLHHVGQSGQPGGGTGEIVPASSLPKPVVQWRVACRGNVASVHPLAESFCAQAVQACSGTPDPHDVLYWRFTLPSQTGAGPHGLWLLTGQACIGAGQVAAVAALPALTLEDFQRLPLPPGTAHVQPDRGWALINVATNVYVNAPPVTLHTSLLGFGVEVKATPVRYRWTFGEGPASQALETTDPGGAYPAMTTTHTYEAPGAYRITLTTFYTGEYSVDGGPWLTVDGQAHVDTPPIPIELIEARTHLVGGSAG